MAAKQTILIEELALKLDGKKPNLIFTGNHLTKLVVPRIESGIFLFDYYTLGGIPMGRITQFQGVRSSGKTTHALRIAGRYQQKQKEIEENKAKRKKVLWIDFEHAFDYDWAKNFLVDVDEFYLIDPDYGEQGVDMIVELIKAEDIGLLVIDSIAMIIPVAEATASATDDFVGQQTKLVNKLLRKIIPIIAQKKAEQNPLTTILINQARASIGTRSFQPTTTPPCGYMVSHVVSMDIKFYNKGYEKSGDMTTKCTHAFVLEKNRVGLPKLTGEYKTYIKETKSHKIGDIIDVKDVIEKARKHNILTKKGTKWECLGSVYVNLVAATTAIENDNILCNAVRQAILDDNKVGRIFDDAEIETETEFESL